MYHKVALSNPTMWWVSQSAFARQMNEISSRKIVYLDDYDPSDPEHVVLTFDDAYECVYQYAFPILKSFGYPFEIFAIGALTGKTNEFDTNEPFATCCTFEQFHEMNEFGARIQWHSQTHPHLPELPLKTQASELDIPEVWRSQFAFPNLRWLAYPYGEYSSETIALARDRFAGALSVHQGNDTDTFKLNRVIMEESTTIDLVSRSARN